MPRNSASQTAKHIWASDYSSNKVFEVQASTGSILNQWTVANNAQGVLVAAGKVFVAGSTPLGSLYVIDPTQPPGPVTVAAINLGVYPIGIAFDGTNIWTANSAGSVSIITPQATTPYPATTVTAGFIDPFGILYDGAHIWVTDRVGTLLKLDATGAILQTVTVGADPRYPVFDGTNIWVPNSGSNSITVVQASTGSVVATISADASNKLRIPIGTAFDGERVLVTNDGRVTVFKAADLSFIANVVLPAHLWHPCSDGTNFWVPVEILVHPHPRRQWAICCGSERRDGRQIEARLRTQAPRYARMPLPTVGAKSAPSSSSDSRSGVARAPSPRLDLCFFNCARATLQHVGKIGNATATIA